MKAGPCPGQSRGRAAAGDGPRPGALEALGDLSGNGSGSGKLQRAGAPGRWRRSVQGRGSGPRKPGGPGSAEKAAEISEDPAGGPGRHPGGGKAAEAGNPGKIAEYKTQ